jgi:hypothetical protein
VVDDPTGFPPLAATTVAYIGGMARTPTDPTGRLRRSEVVDEATAPSDDGDMDADVARLADALDELASLLAAHDEPFWADWVGQDARWVRNGDGFGVTHFLSAFGGMGSLNDLVLGPIDADGAGSDSSDLHERFDRLRRAAWEAARALAREAV